MINKPDEELTWEERVQINKDYYNCPDDHKKVKTRIYSVTRSGNQKQANEARDYDDVACLDCKAKKMRWDMPI
jgi:hypothetical protein